MPISHKHQPLVYPDYINPLPVDDIIKVGAVKQDLYEKNYDKIQSHINELDKYGLEIVRENDKKYFSQEMNKFM
jgi:phage-related protein